MGKQIRFFRKNIIDLQNPDAEITVTDPIAYNSGQDIVDFLRNRNNNSAWLTTGSSDAANTEMLVQFGVGRDVTDIILVKHNWKAFTIQYWDEIAFDWADFSTPINETNNSDETTNFQFDSVETNQIKIKIFGTQIPDDDKELFQLIVTSKIGSGSLEGWPVIKGATHDTNKRKTKMLSGKLHVIESIGSFGCDLDVTNWKSVKDIEVVEGIYFRREAVLVWLGGGDEEQFHVLARGYRKEDLYLMRPTDYYSPDYVKGIYSAGLKIKISLQEAIE